MGDATSHFSLASLTSHCLYQPIQQRIDLIDPFEQTAVIGWIAQITGKKKLCFELHKRATGNDEKLVKLLVSAK